MFVVTVMMDSIAREKQQLSKLITDKTWKEVLYVYTIIKIEPTITANKIFIKDGLIYISL